MISNREIGLREASDIDADKCRPDENASRIVNPIQTSETEDVGIGVANPVHTPGDPNWKPSRMELAPMRP